MRKCVKMVKYRRPSEMWNWANICGNPKCQNGQILEAIWSVKLSKYRRRPQLRSVFRERMPAFGSSPPPISTYITTSSINIMIVMILLRINICCFYLIANDQGLLCLTSILMNSQCLKISYCWTIVLTAFKGWFYIWIFHCMSTFKSNNSLSSTEEKPKNQDIIS